MNLKSNTLLLALVLATTALAGCTGGDDGTPTPASPTETTPTPTTPTETTPTTPTTPVDEPVENVTAPEYNLTVEGIPAIVTAGNAFTFNLTVDGPVGASDHLGAHFANNTTAAPTPPGRGDCVHNATAVLPGTFQVTCTLTQAGVWYVYGHLQTLVGENRTNFWAEPVAVTAYDYDLVLELANQTGLNATFSLNITGSPNSTTDHAGAHWATSPSVALTVSAMEGGCTHEGDSAPSNFTISCAFPAAGTYYVFGHYRLTVDGTTESFWSAPVEVTVAADTQA